MRSKSISGKAKESHVVEWIVVGARENIFPNVHRMHKHTHTHKLKTAAIRVNICNIHNQLGAETMNEPSQTCLRQHEWNETIVLNIMNYTLSAYLHMARLLTENRFSIDDAHRNRLITKWRLGWPAITPTIMLFEKGSRTFCQTCANKLCINLIRRAKHSFVLEYDSWKLWRDDPQHYVYASRSIPNEIKTQSQMTMQCMRAQLKREQTWRCYCWLCVACRAVRLSEEPRVQWIYWHWLWRWQQAREVQEYLHQKNQTKDFYVTHNWINYACVCILCKPYEFDYNGNMTLFDWLCLER